MRFDAIYVLKIHRFRGCSHTQELQVHPAHNPMNFTLWGCKCVVMADATRAEKDDAGKITFLNIFLMKAVCIYQQKNSKINVGRHL